MRNAIMVSLGALALTLAGPAVAQTATTAAPALVLPSGTGIFAAPSTLPFQAPDFSKIKDSDYLPAILQGIEINRAEIELIANNPAAPSFENTIIAMEKSGQMLTRVKIGRAHV